MTEITIFDELILFTKELIELLHEDWIKTKKFIKENIKYVFWICVLFITMQFTDIISLGSSYDKYCKINGIQRGGAEHAPAPHAPAPHAPAPHAPAPHAPAPHSPGANSKHGSEHGSDGKKGAEHGADGKHGDEGGDNPKKDKAKKKSLKDKLSGSIKNNPVLGHLDKIFGMVETMVMLIMFILIVIGIMSLPILVFITLTYCILKIMFTKLIIL